MVGMVPVPSTGHADGLDGRVAVRDERVFEVVTCHIASNHDVVREPAGVPNDQRHRATGRNLQRGGSANEYSSNVALIHRASIC